MDYVKKDINDRIIERYTIVDYHVNESAKTIAIVLSHVWLEIINSIEQINQTTIATTLTNKAGTKIDPNFVFSQANFEALQQDLPPDFDPYDPTTWGDMILPTVDVPEKKYFDLVTANVASNMSTAILEKLVEQGTLEAGADWSYVESSGGV